MRRVRRTSSRRGLIPALALMPALIVSPVAILPGSAAGAASCPTPPAANDVLVSGARAPITAFAPDPCATGYAALDDQGGVFTFGSMSYYGSIPELRAGGQPVGPRRVIDMTSTPSRGGYLMVDEGGGVFSFGDAVYRGSLPALRAAGTPVPPVQVIEMAMTRSGAGYFMLDTTGGIFSFGDARYGGSLPQLRSEGALPSRAPATDMATTPGGGYLVIDSPGGVYAFGAATYRGSLPSLRQEGRFTGTAEAVAIAVTPSGGGYVILDRAGGVVTFGDALYAGSAAGAQGPAPAVDIELTPTGRGYWVLFENGAVHAFGDARDFGSVIGTDSPISADLFSRLNGERARRGLAPLEWDGGLAAAGVGWSRHMSSAGVQHGAWTFVSDRAAYEAVGENLGRASGSPPSAGAIHAAWMNSDTHRMLLLEPGFDSVGIGVACAGGQLWATQVFGRRVGSSSPAMTQRVPPRDPTAFPGTGGAGC